MPDPVVSLSAVIFEPLDGALVLKMQRGWRVEQIRVLEGKSFDLERSAPRLHYDFDEHMPAVLARLRNVAAIMTP